MVRLVTGLVIKTRESTVQCSALSSLQFLKVQNQCIGILVKLSSAANVHRYKTVTDGNMLSKECECCHVGLQLQKCLLPVVSPCHH